MNSLLRISAILLLLFNGIGALYGGWSLISHPDGSGMGMPLSMLQHSPFHDYYIPGWILLICNGLFSISILALLITGDDRYKRLLVLQGIILLGWLLVQVVMIQTFVMLQLVCALAGIGMILTGVLSLHMKQRKLVV